LITAGELLWSREDGANIYSKRPLHQSEKSLLPVELQMFGNRKGITHLLPAVRVMIIMITISQDIVQSVIMLSTPHEFRVIKQIKQCPCFAINTLYEVMLETTRPNSCHY
jgi:hypothetical protein